MHGGVRNSCRFPGQLSRAAAAYAEFMVLLRVNKGHTGQGSSGERSTPVFVDSTGRRARYLRRTGYGLATAAATYMAVLGLSLMGATPFAPGAILPGDIAGPAAPAPHTPGRTPQAPGGLPASGPVGPGSPSTLLVPQAARSGAPVAPPRVPGDPSTGSPARPDTSEPPAPTTTPGQPAAPGDPAAPTPTPGTGTAPAPGTGTTSAPGTGTTPASPPPAPPTTAPPAPQPPAQTPPSGSQPPAPVPSPVAPSGSTATLLPSEPSVAEAS